MRFRVAKLFLFAFCLAGLVDVLAPLQALAAGSWSYSASDADTPLYLDQAATNARVDTAAHEIRLPEKPVPDVASFLPGEGIEYAVLTKTGVKVFSFDGTQMVENTLLSISGLSSPPGLATPPPYPDVVVAAPDGIRHYSFNGSAMVQNPALSVAGLTGIVSVGAKEGDVAALAGNRVKRYLFNGTGMAEATVLEPPVAFTNPVALALAGDYDLVVLEEDRARYFQFTGTGMAENPALAVTGLADPVAVAAAGDCYDVAVVDGNQVKRYSFDGSGMAYSAALSVTSGLNTPTAVAVRPGYRDCLIVDGTQVKYYSFDGSRMVYNPVLSKTVAGIATGGGYRPRAVAVSVPCDPAAAATHVRVRAHHILPPGTSVVWSVTADGAHWVTRWRVRSLAGGGTVAEVTGDNGLAWTPAGDASQVSPALDCAELWAEVQPGRAVRWKAELATTDPAATPVIKAGVGPAVVWEAGARPDPPVLGPVPGWIYTTTPTFTWTFSDPDPGEIQGSYQVVVKRQSDGSPVYDTGQVVSPTAGFTLPTSNSAAAPGPLWLSGAYAFTVEVRTWDAGGMVSDWSRAKSFNVLAFERPRIKEITSPAAGQAPLDPDRPATHIVVTPGMAAANLPGTKAGGKVTVLVDSVGPVEALTARFPYLATYATVGQVSSINPFGSPVNRWEIPFWTAAGLDTCPGGTVVGMCLRGSRPGDYTEFGTTSGETGHGTMNYAEGVVVTGGSVYEDWFVVLQGRN